MNSPQAPATARTYVLLDPARPGKMSAWRADDFTTKVIYQVRDRDGCQTDVQSTIVVDVVGAPVWEKHTGRACAPNRQIDESYTRSGSMGIWQRPQGRGEADVIGKKFYTSATDVPEERALLVRALLAGGNTLKLMPEGDARLALIRTATVKVAAREQTVTGYRLDISVNRGGVRSGSTSSVVWLDTGGDLFAIDDVLIREGWESAVSELRRAAR